MFLFYTNPILIAAAVLPAIFLLVHVYRAEYKLEKEPAPLLISLVLYGIAATFIALVLERAGSFLLGLWFEEGSVAYNAIMLFRHRCLFRGGREVFPAPPPDVAFRRVQLPV